MDIKKISGFLSRFKNPIEVYRFGWFVLASTASLYLFVVIVKAGLGLNNSALRQAQKQSPEVRYSGVLSQQHDRRSDRHGARHAVRNTQRNMQQPKYTQNSVTQRRTPYTQDLRKAVVKNPQDPRTFYKNSFQKRDAYSDNVMKHPVFTQGFVHDLQHTQGKRPRIEMIKTRKSKAEVFGVRLARGRTIRDVRKKWRRISSRYRKKFRNLGPLIIKEKTGDGYPIQLIIGPFTSPNRAVRFCASMKKKFNCNLKRYSGTPL